MATNPGFAQQGQMRTVFRVVGVLAAIGFVALLVLFVRDSAAVMADDSMDAGMPNFVLVLLAMPLLLVAGLCLNAGFGGAATRYAAGEVMPVAKDSLEYLTDGRGLDNLGKSSSAEKSGPFCSRCGVRNDEGARFCDACGTALAST